MIRNIKFETDSELKNVLLRNDGEREVQDKEILAGENESWQGVFTRQGV